MWGSGRDADRSSVVCIACGDSLAREDAREYDKEGDRWTRRDKEFEYVCKACYRELSHQPRGELEGLLVDVEETAEADSPEAFVRAYQSAVRERYGPLESESESGSNSDSGSSSDSGSGRGGDADGRRD